MMKKNESLDERTFMYIDDDELDLVEYLFKKLKKSCISSMDLWLKLKEDLTSEKEKLSEDDPRYVFLLKVLGKMSLLEFRYLFKLSLDDVEYKEKYDDFGDEE